MRDRIDVLLNDIRPDSCLNEGLDCRTCTHATASQIATICPTMTPDAVQGAFFEIYRHSSCHPMCQAFEWAYLSHVQSRREAAADAVAVADAA
jgi:hypothetical protein